MNNDFLERPIWQQYLICILLPSTLFFIGYQFFIQDLKLQADHQMTLYKEKRIETKSLQARIERYQATKNSSLTLITEHELAKAIEHYNLSLTSFKHEQNDLEIYWDVELNGPFACFMSDFNNNFYYLNFQNLSISKQDSYLKIKFSLQFKREDTR